MGRSSCEPAHSWHSAAGAPACILGDPTNPGVGARMFRKFLMIALLALPAAALASGSAPQVVKQALAKVAPDATVTHIGKAPMPGFYQALVHGRLVYVSADGQYVMAGQLFDSRAVVNLTQQRMSAIRLEALATVPASDRLVFAPQHPKYTVTVFTDVDCAYCRVFHQHIEQYNAEGIAVQYLFWPRTGIKSVPGGEPTPSYNKAVSVWCAKDRHKAFTAAMKGGAVPRATCSNPVAREYRLGESIGVDGTPTIVAGDGSVVGGYLPPRQLLQALRMVRMRQAAQGHSASADAKP
jgi:thiol:disulfide interchange protein DsbC